MKKLLVLTVGAIILTGCVERGEYAWQQYRTPAQIQHYQSTNELEYIKEKVKECHVKLEMEQAENIKLVIAAGLKKNKDLTLKDALIKRKATDKEIDAYLALAEADNKCKEIYIEGLTRLRPNIASIEIEDKAASRESLRKLAMKEISIGEYNNSRMQRAEERKSKLMSASQDYSRNMQEQHQSAIANRKRSYAEAKTNCEAEALRKFPIKDMNDTGYNTNCTGSVNSYSGYNNGNVNMNCTSSKKPRYSWLNDTNKLSRDIAYSQCMKSQGHN